MGGDRPKPKSVDAVILVPGIMGSELVDTDGSVLWGMDVTRFVAGLRGTLMERLRVRDEDLDGSRGVRPVGLLRYPVVLGALRGNEDYSSLVRRVCATAADPRAVAGFAYDWRLSVVHNGGLLTRFAAVHWEACRSMVIAEELGDPDAVGLTVVAHSMGGLVARAAQAAGLAAAVEGAPVQVVTLGTPVYGAVKTVRLLAEGRGAPPFLRTHERVRKFAASSPGVHDLLPWYRCVKDSMGTRHLSTDDVATFSDAPRHMADDARVRRDVLAWEKGPGDVAWRSLGGVEQPTLQSLDITADGPVCHGELGGFAPSGPAWGGYSVTPVAQTHGALVAASESYRFVEDKLLRRDESVPLGTSRVGVEFPDTALAGEPLTVRAVKIEDREEGPVASGSGGLTASSVNLAQPGSTRRWFKRGVGADGWVTFTYAGLEPGMHRVSVRGGAASPVTDLIWVEEDSR